MKENIHIKHSGGNEKIISKVFKIYTKLLNIKKIMEPSSAEIPDLISYIFLSDVIGTIPFKINYGCLNSFKAESRHGTIITDTRKRN